MKLYVTTGLKCIVCGRSLVFFMRYASSAAVRSKIEKHELWGPVFEYRLLWANSSSGIHLATFYLARPRVLYDGSLSGRLSATITT